MLDGKRSERYSAVSARAVPAKVVHLEEAEPLAEDLHILHEFRRTLDVVYEGECELGARRQTFDLTRVRDGGRTVDAVLEFDLADVGVELHAAKLGEGLRCHADV